MAAPEVNPETLQKDLLPVATALAASISARQGLVETNDEHEAMFASIVVNRAVHLLAAVEARLEEENLTLSPPAPE